MKRPFKLALVQMLVRGGQKQANLEHAEELIRQAAAEGAEVVVLPEAMTLGWTHPSARTGADAIPAGESYRRLQEAARRNKVYLCSGLIERADDLVFNSAILLSPDGHLLLHHRKLNELEIGHDFYALGDRLQVARTPLATFGLMICADGFARGQVISRTLGYMGADAILSPSAWAVVAEHDNQAEPYGRRWTENYGPVAKDFRLWMVGVSNVGWITDGPWKGRKCIGCSLVVGPSGSPVLRGPYGEEAEAILHVEVTPEERPAQGDGWERFWTN